MNKVNIIGAGLAGCEAAWLLAKHGIEVTLFEQKPIKFSPAHSHGGFAELVCSNSLKAERVNSAAGLLKAEMSLLCSLTVETALGCRVPAGGALAVDKGVFSEIITQKIRSNPLITVVDGEQTCIPQGITIIATGPLTEGGLAGEISAITGDYLSFYDAAAPIVQKSSVDFSSAFYGSRYDRGTNEEGDYINCPMNKAEYERFYSALVSAECAIVRSFDKGAVYEGCMPIEVLAGRGADTMRYGPLKPVGLTDPRTEKRPYANLQLRRENLGDTMYNLVGFQTNLKFPEQQRVFSLIPALKNAEFVRYGVMHRNSFINSPRCLNTDSSLTARPEVFMAGQLTGVEGYMESAAGGIYAALNVVRRLAGDPSFALPPYTMMGALMGYITDRSVTKFQPMGANFGLLPTLDEHIRDKQERYAALAERSLSYIKLNINR